MTVIACISLISSVLQMFPTFYHHVSFLKHSAVDAREKNARCGIVIFMSSLIRVLIVTGYYLVLHCCWCYEARLLPLHIRDIW